MASVSGNYIQLHSFSGTEDVTLVGDDKSNTNFLYLGLWDDSIILEPMRLIFTDSANASRTDATIYIKGFDIFDGGPGNDILDASAYTGAAAILRGGSGNDTLIGGPGKITFAWTKDDIMPGQHYTDIVRNFKQGTDRIDVLDLTSGSDPLAVSLTWSDDSSTIVLSKGETPLNTILIEGVVLEGADIDGYTP